MNAFALLLCLVSESPATIKLDWGGDPSAVVVVQDVPSLGSGVAPRSPNQDAAPEFSRNRILVVIGCTTPACREFERGFRTLRTRLVNEGWTVGGEPTNQMQVLDIRNPEHADLIDAYLPDDETRALPIVVKLEGGKVVREIKHGCGTPFDRWSAWWLFTGRRAADDPGTRTRVTVQASGGYPVRGGWWSHSEGNLRRHLMSGQHAGKFGAAWLNSLSGAELESLHSDDHEGRVKWAWVRRTTVLNSSRTETPARSEWRYSQPRSYYCPNCPNQ